MKIKKIFYIFCLAFLLPGCFSGAGFCQEMIKAEKLRELRIQKAAFTLVDVRTPVDFQRRHIEGAINIPKAAIKDAKLPKNGTFILYCGEVRCPTSHEAAKILISAGYHNVKVLYGGIAEWEHLGFPMTPDPAATAKPRAKSTLLPQGDIKPAQLLARIQNHDGVVILDTRPAREFITGHLPGAKNIPLERLSDELESVINAAEIVVYDRLMERSRKAAQQLAQAGLRARALSGGIAVWAMSGYRLETSPVEGPGNE